MKFSRCEILFGKENFEALSTKSVMIIGIGGVGGYVAEMLARTGIGTIGIIDFDKIDVSNINRQLIATISTVGQYKTDAMIERLKDINENLHINAYNEKLEKHNIDDFNLKSYDYIVDAIDIIDNKIDLIEYCLTNEIKIISAMGAGNKTSIPEYSVCDIFKTEYDKLAKVVRKKLKERNITKHMVVFSKQQAEKTNSNEVGSVVYHPAMCGCVISAFVINQLIKGE